MSLRLVKLHDTKARTRPSVQGNGALRQEARRARRHDGKPSPSLFIHPPTTYPLTPRSQPETAAVTENEMPQVQLNGSSPNALVNSAAGAAGALAGWAISSLSRQIASGTLQTTVASTLGASIDRPTSAPAAHAGTGNTLAPATSSTSSSSGGSKFGTTRMQSDMGLVPGGMSTSKSKSMQLGATKLPASVSSSIPDWAEEAAAEVDASAGANPWGNDDLMDVNADEDDWSECAPAHRSRLEGGVLIIPISIGAFETAAPAPPAVSEPTDFGFGSVHSSGMIYHLRVVGALINSRFACQTRGQHPHPNHLWRHNPVFRQHLVSRRLSQALVQRPSRVPLRRQIAGRQTSRPALRHTARRGCRRKRRQRRWRGGKRRGSRWVYSVLGPFEISSKFSDLFIKRIAALKEQKKTKS